MDLVSALPKLESLIEQTAEMGRLSADRRSELMLDEKSAGQFASSADIEIERFLRAELVAQFPDIPVIGEEMGGALTDDQTGWAIDPIDGTSNFVLGLPIWGISVGYLARGRSILGAIALPALGLTVSAADGRGLRVNAAPASAERGSPVKLIALGENDFEPGPETDARAQRLRDQGYAVVRYRCAVFSLAMSALGRLGGYVEHGCGLWDIAAAEVICREAGMQCHSEQIAPGRYAVEAIWI